MRPNVRPMSGQSHSHLMCSPALRRPRRPRHPPEPLDLRDFRFILTPMLPPYGLRLTPVWLSCRQGKTVRVAGRLAHGAYGVWSKGVGLLTMFCLSYLMIGVGQEFHLDKSKLGSYGKDYAIAMSAAGLPWLFVAAWLHYALPSPLAWGSALLMARFAAPTSAGILFSMLEAAGFKETWLFQKARILAIFDDLDTILLMIPLKMFLVGFKWELTVDAVFVSVCLFLAWQKLHNIRAASQKLAWNPPCVHSPSQIKNLGAYVLSGGAVHLEVLLPAFTIGAATRMCQETDEWCEVLDEGQEERVRSRVATVFMLLVGLSMPSLFAGGAGTMSTATTVYHVFVVSVLMVIGKMLLLFTYRDEANLRTRLALSLGMCPRGEVVGWEGGKHVLPLGRRRDIQASFGGNVDVRCPIIDRCRTGSSRRLPRVPSEDRRRPPV
ncbi:unnamed protein product [Prorocentrum cordatum]|uniref:Cation/H+ exchanger transmembrane domain-containing protein n=1 Tax=Prorocentrum cordatum TaxID=2364126 RepID=A0ABN9RM12_9DINO|nr:unnamed protein product [Polarella glacialis]